MTGGAKKLTQGIICFSNQLHNNIK